MRLKTTYARCFTLLITASALAASLTACATGDQVMYCADEHRYVVEANRCDGQDDAVFIYHGYWNTNYRPGMQLNTNGMYGDANRGSGRIVSTDADARTKAGLPRVGGFGGNGATFTGGKAGG